MVVPPTNVFVVPPVMYLTYERLTCEFVPGVKPFVPTVGYVTVTSWFNPPDTGTAKLKPVNVAVPETGTAQTVPTHTLATVVEAETVNLNSLIVEAPLVDTKLNVAFEEAAPDVADGIYWAAVV
jgi:hypothetical protein